MNPAPNADDLLAELTALGAGSGSRRAEGVSNPPRTSADPEGPDDWHEGPEGNPRQRHPQIEPDEICQAYVEMKKRVMARAGGSGLGGTWMSKDGIKRVRYSHEDCIDRILMTPSITQIDLAQIYGVTNGWMTIVVNSDAFKVKLAERRQELIDPALLASLNERYGALAARSVEVLLEKLSQPVEKISDKLALEAAALGAKSMGLGEPKVPQGPSAVDHLAKLAHRLMDLNHPLPVVVEVGGEGEALVPATSASPLPRYA